MRLVLDPSVVIKFYIPEVLSDIAETLELAIQTAPHFVSVPALFYSEIGNIVWKKYVLRNHLSRAQSQAIVRSMLKLPFEVIDDKVLMGDAFKIAVDFEITMHDAVYLACMRYTEGEFISADERLVNKVKRAPWASRAVFLRNWGKAAD